MTTDALAFAERIAYEQTTKPTTEAELWEFQVGDTFYLEGCHEWRRVVEVKGETMLTATIEVCGIVSPPIQVRDALFTKWAAKRGSSFARAAG